MAVPVIDRKSFIFVVIDKVVGGRVVVLNDKSERRPGSLQTELKT